MKEKQKSLKDVFIRIHYLLGFIWSFDKRYILLIPFTSISKSLLTFAVILFPKFIIDEITGQKRMSVALLLTVSMAAVLVVLRLFNNLIDAFNNRRIVQIKSKIQLKLQDKVTRLPFWRLESPEILDRYQKAAGIVKVWQADIQRLTGAINGMITALLTIIGISWILFSLNLLVFLVIFLIVVFNTVLNSSAVKKQLAFYKSCAPHVRKINYLMNELQENEYAKEIRGYQMQEWISAKASTLLTRVYKNTSANINYQTIVQCAGVTAGILQDGASYLYVGWLLMRGLISIGDFSMYISAINTFSLSLKDIFSNFLIIQEAGMYVEEFRLFMELEENGDCTDGEESKAPLEPDSGYVLEAVDLWFKYPGSDTYTLKNINLKIEWNEIISIVGDNGAGKTTFIKLLMRLYEPTKGEIRLNGKNIKEYEFSEYVKKLGVVFQDYKILAFKMNENIALTDAKNISKERLQIALKKAGLLEKALSLPEGDNTYITRKFEEGGVELSGGEQQKLAICHAIYKDSPIMILDEPTANLSPMAEYEVFLNFKEIMKGKTGIYISHRMSSCRLSNRILVFKNGEIIENGSHEVLLKDGREYAKMYGLQAEFYKNKETFG
jgi:ATP-binding cassette subfamily B protein/ATP-binding cassette subfamily C protein